MRQPLGIIGELAARRKLDMADLERRLEQIRREQRRKERITAPLRPLFRLPLVGDVVNVFWTGLVWQGWSGMLDDLRDTFIRHIYVTPSEQRRAVMEYRFDNEPVRVRPPYDR